MAKKNTMRKNRKEAARKNRKNTRKNMRKGRKATRKNNMRK